MNYYFSKFRFIAKQVSWLLLSAASITVFTTSPARADFILGNAANYAVLFEGEGNGNTLHITNVTIKGNVGVGGTGKVSDSGPSTVSGRIDLSAANTGQVTVAPADIGPTSINYNVAAVTTALNTVNALSTSLGSETGTSLMIKGTQTINASNGMLDGSGNEVFNVTSYSENDGNVLTINGNGHNVVLNLAVNGNPQLGGDIILNGLTPDQVMFNYTGKNNLSLNNNASSYPSPDAFMGIILAPNAAISVTNSNLDGRVFGGDSSDMQIVSGTTINAPVIATPEPSTCFLAGLSLVGLGVVGRRKRAKASGLK
jgi:choice-of-anchor A domain-containing protein